MDLVTKSYKSMAQTLKRNSMIYTLNYIEDEARKIIGTWNGSDEKMNLEGTLVDAEYFVNGAEELLEKLEEVRILVRDLSI